MAVTSRRKARSKRKEAVYKEILDYLNSEAMRENDLIAQRVYELTEGRHVRLTEAMKIVCEELGIK